jgi:DNA polymerase III epsilon subunit-like protein
MLNYEPRKNVFLILDTETSGLDCANDYVIEIGGIIATFNKEENKLEYLDSFQSLINLQVGLVDRISELTGILKEELDLAPKRHVVQQEWQSFIQKIEEKYTVTHVLGHSLDFDLGFLEFENWYLPSNFKPLDTLDMVKICMQDSIAINLDHLSHTYDLDTHFPISIPGLNHHRALFDSFLCAGLFNLCLQKIETLNITPDLTFALNEFLNLKLKTTEKSKISIDKTNQNFRIKNSVFQDEKITEDKLFLNLNKLQFENEKLLQKSLENLETKEEKGNDIRPYKRVILQIWTRLLNPTIITEDGNINLHINGNIEWLFYNLIQKSLTQDIDRNELPIIWLNPEKLILDNSHITTQTFNISSINDYLKIVNDLYQDTVKEVTELSIIKQAIISETQLAGDGKSFGSLEVLKNGSNSGNLRIAIEDLQAWLTIVYKKFSTLNKTNLGIDFLNYLAVASVVLDDKDSRDSVNYNFYSNQGQSNITFTKNLKFNLSDFYLQSLMKSSKIVTNLTIESYKDLEDLFLAKLDTSILDTNKYEIESLEMNTPKNYEDTIANYLLENSNFENLRVIIVGKNATLKTLPNLCENLGVEYLDISKTGSTSKLITQVNKGYRGVVIVSYKYLDSFLRNVNFTKIEYKEFCFHPNLFLPLTPALSRLTPSDMSNYNFNLEVSSFYLEYLSGEIYRTCGSGVSIVL